MYQDFHTKFGKLNKKVVFLTGETATDLKLIIKVAVACWLQNLYKCCTVLPVVGHSLRNVGGFSSYAPLFLVSFTSIIFHQVHHSVECVSKETDFLSGLNDERYYNDHCNDACQMVSLL